MIFKIFKKELKDTLRDRRTIVMMLVIPVLLFPVLLNLSLFASKHFEDEAANKSIKIGVICKEDNYVYQQLLNLPQEIGEREIIIYQDSLSLKNDIKTDSIQAGYFMSGDFNESMSAKKTAQILIFYNATKLGMQDRAKNLLETINNIASQERLIDLNIKKEDITPFQLDYINVASTKETFGKLAGGFLPYIFIAFGFMGCMYPAIDLFTGEKERGTIETLLTSPVERWKILFGKMGVVVLSGLLASSAALLGLFLSIEVLQIVDEPKILEIVHSILSPQFIGLLYLLLTPLVVFFAGVMIPIAIYAKSFKEAQSIITPLNIVMILPAAVGFFPGIELNLTTSIIPVVNIVLATKEMIAGTLDTSYMLLSFTIMILLAVASVFVSYKRFDNEKNIMS